MRLAEFIVRVNSFNRHSAIEVGVRSVLGVMLAGLGAALISIIEPICVQLAGEIWAPPLAMLPALDPASGNAPD